MNAIAIHRQMTALGVPMELTRNFEIGTVRERDAAVHDVQEALRFFNRGLWGSEQVAARQAFVAFAIRTHNYREIAIYHKLRDDQRLLLSVEHTFSFDDSLLPVSLEDELMRYVERWPHSRRTGFPEHPAIVSTVVYGGEQEDVSILEPYEGHDDAPSLLVRGEVNLFEIYGRGR